MPMKSIFKKDFQLLTTKTQELGWDDVLYSFYPRPMYLNKQIQPVLHFSEGFGSFVAHYIRSNYGNRDFVLRLAMNRRETPIDWWEDIEAGNVTPEEMEVTLDAKNNFEIHQGLSVPVLDGTFAIAGISVISKNSDRDHFLRLKNDFAQDLYDAANEYHLKTIAKKDGLLFFIQPLMDSLNEKKQAVIKHLITGKPLKVIDKTYDITPEYAKKVVAKLRKEFGNVTTNELIYLMGLINIQKYLSAPF